MGIKNLCCNKSGGYAPSEPEKKEPETINPNQDGTGRIQWSSPTEFLLTCIGYSVGLGNVWRFPYLCYKSGGGAFLIPYIIMMILIGMPLLFMEYSFGQYFGVGSLSIYKKVCPMFSGIGIGYTVLNGFVCIYYNVIIALSLYYLFASFTANLPWASCGNPWNTPLCQDDARGEYAMGNDTISNATYTADLLEYLPNNTYVKFYNGTKILLTSLTSNLTDLRIGNLSDFNVTLERNEPSDEYFRFGVLGQFEDINVENLGEIRWPLCLCLLLAWILVILFVSRGIQSTGKVAYFTATFPYVMLTVLVVRGATLPGASKGLLYFISPVWEKLAQPEVWYGAATQLFYSTNLAWGGMITMASYNSFNHNCFRDAIMINIVSFCTSLYAGVAVFSIIGYMASEYNLDVAEVIKSGPGLAFIVYPRALSLMPLAPMWSALFFFMLFLLGIGSQMVDVETVMTGLCDEFPVLKQHRFKVLILVGTVFFIVGLPQTCQGGMYVLELMDWYSAGFSVLIIGVMECVVICWIYGDTKFACNVKEMLSKLPERWWTICWKFISPLLIAGILVFSLAKYKPAKYGNYYYPVWADSLGWCITLASTLPIFVVAAYKLATAPGSTFKEKWAAATKPQVTIEAKSIEEIEEMKRPKEEQTTDVEKAVAEKEKLMGEEKV